MHFFIARSRFQSLDSLDLNLDLDLNHEQRVEVVVWSKLAGDGKTDGKKDGKMIHQNGQDKGWEKPYERLGTEGNGEKWLSDHP